MEINCLLFLYEGVNADKTISKSQMSSFNAQMSFFNRFRLFFCLICSPCLWIKKLLKRLSKVPRQNPSSDDRGACQLKASIREEEATAFSGRLLNSYHMTPNYYFFGFVQIWPCRSKLKLHNPNLKNV